MFAENFRLKNNFIANVKSYRINETLEVYLKKKTYLFEMTNDLKKRFKTTYNIDSQWSKIRDKIKTRENKNDTSNEIDFILKKFRILYAPYGKTFRLCISWKLEQKVYKFVHDANHHCGFHRTYAKTSKIVYIRHLTKRLRRYIRHCKQCLKKQIMRHVFYEKLTFIKIMIFFFISFQLILS